MSQTRAVDPLVGISREIRDRETFPLPEEQVTALSPLETQPVSAESLPLPTGAATEAKQDDLIIELDGLLRPEDLVFNAEGKLEVNAHNPIGEDVSAGRIFTSGGEVTLTAGQTGAIVVSNPAASGKMIIILGFAIFSSDAASLMVQFVEDPTVTGGTAQAAVQHFFGSGIAAVATTTTGQGILSSGTVLSPRLRVRDTTPFVYNGAPFMVPENKKLAARVTAGLSGTTVDFNATWKEIAT